MNEQEQNFYVAETADGAFVAYTTCAPFFCFVKQTEAEAIAIAERALKLVDQIDFDKVHVKSPTRTVTELTPTRVIPRDSIFA